MEDSCGVYSLILFSNLVKYAQPETRVYINTIRTIDNNIMISIKNVSREALNISAEELTQRFVRGDESRHSEGSGLGLNIVENLVNLQKRSFQYPLLTVTSLEQTLSWPQNLKKPQRRILQQNLISPIKIKMEITIFSIFSYSMLIA